jgi:hypothetical protein
MAATETYTNNATTTVTSGGATAGTSGTVESWGVTSSASFPAASTGVTQFHVGDPAQPTELIAVTAAAGTAWTVTRGAESTTPVSHAPGFTVDQVITAGGLNGLVSSASAATYAVVTGGTAAAAPFQQVASLGTPGQFLASAGAGALPSWQAAPGFVPGDLGYLEWAYDPLVISAGTALIGAGTISLIRVNVRAARTVTNVVTYLATLGSGLTTGGNFAGLYSSGGSLIGTSADQTAVWNTGSSTGVKTAALNGGTPVSVPAGFCWAALMYNGSGAPQFGRAFNVTAAISNAGFTSTTARFASAIGGTILPTSITVASNALNATEFWAALS